MASDTLSLNTVAWLLPEPWFKFLASVRCPFYVGKFGEGKYAKFSSMGNGATFSLETLIFCACCYAVGSKAFSVYGDDIIIESDLAEALIRLLAFIGFSVNTEKSYIGDISFRESCGKHYCGGIDVTPKYLRDGGLNKQVLSHNVNTLASIADCGGRLASALLNIVRDQRLIIVPFSESSIEGVWVDIHTAYEKRLLYPRNWVLSRKRYVPIINRKTTVSIVDTRSLFLWYLVKYQGRDLLDAVTTSRYSPLHLRYRCKVGAWFPPSVATPGHLYWWSEQLVRAAE